MQFSLSFVVVSLIPFCFGDVAPIFDVDTVNDALIALIPTISIPPLSTQFGGCSDDEEAAITQAWNDAMNNIIPGARTALSQPFGAVSQIDNIFDGLFGFTTDQGIDFPTRPEIASTLPKNMFLHALLRLE